MNNFEGIKLIPGSPFEEMKAQWWIVEGKTLRLRVKTVNAETSFEVGEFVIAKNVVDAGGLISTAAAA